MLSLRSDNLYLEVLLDPAKQGYDQLTIVSGYASPRMLAKHLSDLRQAGLPHKVKLRLVIGMSGNNLNEVSQSAYLGLMFNDEAVQSTVLLAGEETQVHSKCFLWEKAGASSRAWVGSANYTLLGFGLKLESDNRDEILIEVPADRVSTYVAGVLSRSNPLSGHFGRRYLEVQSESPEWEVQTSDAPFELPKTLSSERFAVCPLISRRTGRIHNSGAGLNWGQPSRARTRADKDAAYIPLPSSTASLFPDIGMPFEVELPDGQVLVMARSQAGGKALTTPASNQLLGRYFRATLGVDFGKPIETEDLERFGSDCVVFEKVDRERFRMHFYPGLIREALQARSK